MKTAGNVIKALFVSYIITAIILFLLAFLLYKMNITGAVVQVGVMFSYLVSTFVGGLIVGKAEANRHFLWGLIVGLLYFAVIFIISFVVNQNMFEQGAMTLTVLAMCGFGGMLGGMVS